MFKSGVIIKYLILLGNAMHIETERLKSYLFKGFFY